jgi:predicted membrane-bound spermidine synthase
MLKIENKKPKLKEILKIVGIMFVCTGCAGLLAEQCFEKMLTSLVGASTPAAAIVLSVYFLGLMLGALLYSRFRDMRWKPLSVYALLEAGIGTWAILLLLSYQVMIVLFAPVLSLGANKLWILQSLRFIVACFWILPPTMLMGATFPAIVDFLESSRVPIPRKAMSVFYSLNLAGAIMGALIGPYFTFPSWGLHGTLVFTAIIDITVALIVFIITRSIKQRSLGKVVKVSEIAIKLKSFREHRVILIIAFISGFLCFGFEVLWVHLIGAVLGNSVYAFAAMLALVLAGLGIGGWFSVFLFKESKPISPFFTSIILLSLSAVVIWQYTVWPHIPSQLISWGGNLRNFWEGELLRWIQAGRLLLPASIIMGMIYPTIFRMSIFPVHNRAQVAAIVSGVNSIGCVLGALVCGFAFIPLIGSERTLLLFGMMATLTGLVLSLIYSKGFSRIAVVAASLLLIIGWTATNNWDRLALTSGGHVYFKEGHVNSFSKLAYFHEDTLGGITTVIYNPAGKEINSTPKTIRILLTNGKFQADDSKEVNAQTGFALIPSLHSCCRDNALVIGLGSGHSAEIVKRMGFRHVDLAEISPGIADAARKHFAHINGDILEQPDVRLFLEDGRNYLLLHQNKYDMITMEISSIWFAGSTSLYSREFYELCKKRLNKGGIMQQWIQMHHIGIEEVGSVITTMRQVFPYVSFWVFGGQGIIIGSEEPQKIYADAIEKYFQVNLWNDPDETSMKNHLKKLLASRLLAPEDVNRMIKQYAFEINTDANRFLEYSAPKYYLSRENHMVANINNLIRFATFPEHIPEPAWPANFADSAKSATEEIRAMNNETRN